MEELLDKVYSCQHSRSSAASGNETGPAQGIAFAAASGSRWEIPPNLMSGQPSKSRLLQRNNCREFATIRSASRNVEGCGRAYFGQ